LLLGRAEVERLLTPAVCIEAVEDAFRRHALGEMAPPGILGMHVGAGSFHVKAAGLDGAFAAKLNANFPGNPARGLPTIQGAILLFDTSTGSPVALLDSAEITIMRTGAATAVGQVLPDLKGKLDGIAIRVPTPNVSLVDLAAVVEKTTTKDEVNAAFKAAAAGPLKGILAVSEDPLVSIDFRGNANSSIVDVPYTAVMDGNFVKVLSWYDNEWGYSNKCLEMVRVIAK